MDNKSIDAEVIPSLQACFRSNAKIFIPFQLDVYIYNILSCSVLFSFFLSLLSFNCSTLLFCFQLLLFPHTPPLLISSSFSILLRESIFANGTNTTTHISKTFQTLVTSSYPSAKNSSYIELRCFRNHSHRLHQTRMVWGQLTRNLHLQAK